MAAQRQPVRRAAAHPEGPALRLPAAAPEAPAGRDRRAEHVRLRPAAPIDVRLLLQRAGEGRRADVRPEGVGRRRHRDRRLARQALPHAAREDRRGLRRAEPAPRVPATCSRSTAASRRTAALVVACHSGGPDWGSGPTGQGEALQDQLRRPRAPAAGARLARPGRARSASSSTGRSIRNCCATCSRRRRSRPGSSSGPATASSRSGRATRSCRRRRRRRGSTCRSARRSSRPTAARWSSRPTRSPRRCTTRSRSPAWAGPRRTRRRRATLPQHAADRPRLRPVAGWRRRGSRRTARRLWTRLAAAASTWTWRGSSRPAAPTHDALWEAMEKPGELTLKAQLNLTDMLRPAVQPGSKIDYELPAETVTLAFESSHGDAVDSRASTADRRVDQDSRARHASVELRSPKPGRRSRSTIRLDGAHAGTPSLIVRVHAPTRGQAAAPAAAPPRARAVGRHQGRPRQAGRARAGRRNSTAAAGRAGGRCSSATRRRAPSATPSTARAGDIGPDLSNLIHRDYASVLRDITQPSFAINPDYLTQTVTLNGRAHADRRRPHRGRRSSTSATRTARSPIVDRGRGGGDAAVGGVDHAGRPREASSARSRRATC